MKKKKKIESCKFKNNLNPLTNNKLLAIKGLESTTIN